MLRKNWDDTTSGSDTDNSDNKGNNSETPKEYDVEGGETEDRKTKLHNE